MTKAKRTFNLFAISEARNVIFGIATLWIGLFHSFDLSMKPYTDNLFLREAFNFFKGTGNVGVDMFLFLSGVGLFFSFTKDGNVLSFWKKRLMRVLPTALLIGIIYFSFRYIQGRYESGFPTYFKRVTFSYFYYSGERVFWFISLILVLYIVFPIFFKVIERFRGWGTLGLVALVVIGTFAIRFISPEHYAIWEVALCRVPVFIVGIWAGRFVMEKREIDLRWLWIFLAVTVGMLFVLGNFKLIATAINPSYQEGMEPLYMFIWRYASCPLAISLVVLDSFICIELRRHGLCKSLRNFFEFVGLYSMEYYMIYLNINSYLQRVYKIESRHMIMLYFGSFVFSLGLCVVSRKLCDYFMAYMQRKPKIPQPTEESPLSIKWFNFLVYVGWIVFAVDNIFVGVAYITDGQVALGAAALVVTVAAAAAWFFLSKRSSFGVLLLYIVLVLNLLWTLAERALNHKLLKHILEGGKKAILTTLVLTALTVLAIILNKKYFEKRSFLFEKKTDQKAE